MRRKTGLAVSLIMLAVGIFASASVAGPKYRCKLETQACLDKMVTELKTRGWLGIEYDDSKGPAALVVTRVVPGSPAEATRFTIGDVLVSVNGAKFADNTEDRCETCEKTKDVWKPGRKVEYVVVRGGKEVKLAATLAPLPADVMAMMVGMHLVEHAQPVSTPGTESKP